MGAVGGERMGSATGGAPNRWDAGLLHVQEERARAPPRSELTLALLGGLPRFFAVLAADRKRQRPQPLLRNFLAAVEAVAVVPLVEAHEGVVHLVEGFRLHLDERELQIFLDVGFGALDRVEHLVELPA